MHATDAQHCPLCGQANACAVAAGRPAQECWCMAQPVSRAALARLAPGQRGRVCICPHCARELPPAADGRPSADMISPL